MILSKRRPFPSGRAASMNFVSSSAVLADGKARKKVHKKVKAQSVKLLRGILNRIANRRHAGAGRTGYGLGIQIAFHRDPAFLSIYVSSLPPIFEKSSRILPEIQCLYNPVSARFRRYPLRPVHSGWHVSGCLLLKAVLFPAAVLRRIRNAIALCMRLSSKHPLDQGHVNNRSG